jgi:hypothetical protein
MLQIKKIYKIGQFLIKFLKIFLQIFFWWLGVRIITMNNE